ncbi:MAG: family hydrolase [Sphingomonas bacterium]|nr:HAD family hydrolase [Sphingomonas bacterium]MDB5688651.1 family hydrolase [Sphingomonas bacterium]
MPIKAILFDIDGTLVDSNDQHVLAWEEVFRGEGVHFDRQVIHDQIGKGADNLVPTLLPGSDEATHERLGDAHGDVFKARYLDQVQPFPGARELIVRVHQAGQKVVLASSAAKSELDHYTDLLDIRDLVAAATSADDVENTKPAPDIFATALKKVAPLGPDEVIVVGDTPYDVSAAAKCGIATVALRSGKFSDEALRGAGAMCIYDDVAALLADYAGSPLAG